MRIHGALRIYFIQAELEAAFVDDFEHSISGFKKPLK